MLLVVAVALATPNPFAAAAPLGSADDLQQDAALLDLVEQADELGCKTSLVAALRLHWSHLSAADRLYATKAIAPFKDDLFEESLERHPEGAPPPAKESCWDQDMDNVVTGQHFAVEYEDGVDQDDAELFLADLEYSWDIEIDERGWREPDATDDYLFTVYIQNQNTYGAYTTVKNCHGAYMPYIVSGKDSWRSTDWGATMAAHEFNHGVQFGYSYAPEFWYWESTATWIENIVYPDADEWPVYVRGYTDNPWIAFNAEDQRDDAIFWHMYGMAIWNFYLEDYQGGHDVVRETWENAQDERGQYGYGGEDMAEELGLDWDEIYLDFISRNTMMDYAEHNDMPAIDLEDSVSELPAEGGGGKNLPQGYGQNYIKFKAGSGEGDLVVHFEGDDSVDWGVVLVEGDRDEMFRVDMVTTKDGAADMTLTGFGENDAWLVVSPLTWKDDGYEYSWTAEVVEAADPVDDDTGTGGDGNGDGDGNTDGLGDDPDPVNGGSLACGCATSDPSALVAAGTALAALFAARRRK